MKMGPISARWSVLITSILAGTVLLLTGLGAHALWDDEAMDALNAKAILKSGDTVSMIDQNLVAYRDGLLLVKGRQQGMPPLPGYLAAIGIHVFGNSAIAARILFALCGVITITMIMVFAFRLGLQPFQLALVSFVMLTNVSFLLYFRNCHYYGPGIMLTTASLILYYREIKTLKGQLLLGLASGFLLLSNYTWFIALYACLVIDLLIWRRYLLKSSFSVFLRIFTPPFLAGLLILWRWNPLGTKLGGYLHQNSLHQRMKLFFWNWRDLNVCEFISLGVVLLAIFLAISSKENIIRRLLVSLIIYIITITILSTQLLSETSLADVRYMAGCLPICIAITSYAVIVLVQKNIILGLVFALIACGTNIFNGGAFWEGGVRSLICQYIVEIFSPVEDPYTPASQWISRTLKPGATIMVLPDYMTYPLMYHAPNATYAWQLSPEQQSNAQFKDLPPIHFQGKEFPEYIMVFGPLVSQVDSTLSNWDLHGIHYKRIATINTFWKDLYRPEIFWRVFKPLKEYDLNSQAIYIYKRQNI